MTAPPAVGVAPIVMPPNVTVTAVLAATLPVCTTMIINDGLLGLEIAVTPPLTRTVVGVTPTAKKLSGYVSVTVLPPLSKPATVVLKLNVTGTPARFTTRSEGAILNATDVTAPPIPPDAVLADTNGS